MPDIQIEFPGGKRVDAHVGGVTVHTDQPHPDGTETFVGPFELFLASIATCAGFYVLQFCQTRNIDLAGVTLRQHVELDPETHLPRRIVLALGLPPSFPEKYRSAVLRAAEGCKVKKTLAAPPAIEVVVAAA